MMMRMISMEMMCFVCASTFVVVLRSFSFSFALANFYLGTHQGEYAVYRAVAIAQGAMKPDWKPDFTNTTPNIKFGPYPSWSKIVSFDPWGHEVVKVSLTCSSYYRC